MAFTLQFGNTWKQKLYEPLRSSVENSCFSYKEKIGNLNPAICFQADVLYPNALASVINSDTMGLNTCFTVGCVGHQLDNKFPLEPRVPTCLPLVQYPSSTRGESLEEMDMCSKPVLNWENHIKELRKVLHVPLGFMNPKFRTNKQIYKSTEPKPRNLPESDEDETPLNQRLILAKARKTIAERQAMSKKVLKSKPMSKDDDANGNSDKTIGIEPQPSPFLPTEAPPKKKQGDDDDLMEIPVVDDDMPLLQRLWDINSRSEAIRDKTLWLSKRKKKKGKKSRNAIVEDKCEETNNEENKDDPKDLQTSEKANSEQNKDDPKDLQSSEQANNEQNEDQPEDKSNNKDIEDLVSNLEIRSCPEGEDSNYDDAASDITQSTVDINQKKLSNYIQRKLAGKNREGPQELYKKYLFEELHDLEETTEEKRKRLRENKIKGPTPKFRKPNVKLPRIKVVNRDRLPVFAIRKYKDIPELRLQSTWNYLYSALSGACSTMEGMRDQTHRNVFVGCGTQLRSVCLIPAPKDSMLSYIVDSVWEEDKDKVPTNIRPGRNEPLSDLIYQIVPDQKNGFIAVRRGKSVELYDVAEHPNLLTSIPNICYGSRIYAGWKFNRFIKDPLLLSVDINPMISTEILTIDENLVIHGLDYTEGKVSFTLTANREHLTKKEYSQRPYRKYPSIRINDTAGAAYFNANSIMSWSDCVLQLNDRRWQAHNRTTSVQYLFDLRRSEASLSMSDQLYYVRKEQVLNEFITCVKPSQNPIYYYVGTTSRIFMMDSRVPDNPVMKMSHGMRSAAAYIETYHDGNYEVLVAGTQRTHETFCLVTDHAHIACIDRPECKARNPIMHSYPRHLSNSREFYKEVQAHQMTNSWPSDIRRSRDHNYAWTTGLAICKAPRANDPEKPPGISVFTGNHYGDIFYQEWEQAPVDKTRRTFRGDDKLKDFFCKWKDSMETKPEDYEELNKDSLNPKNPVDITLLAKTAADAIPFMTRVRNKKFDIFKPDALQNYTVTRNLPSLKDQVERFRRLRFQEGKFRQAGKSEAALRILSVWGDDWQDNDIEYVDYNKQLEEVAERDKLGRYFEPVDLNELPRRREDEPEEQQPVSILGLHAQSMDDAHGGGMLTEEQSKVLFDMKEEMEENYMIDDSDIAICDSDPENNSSGSEVGIFVDEEEDSNSNTKIETEMSENAQRFSTQDFDELGFPGLGEFYPVMSIPPHILPEGGEDDLFPPSRPPSQGFQTVDMDDNMNFGSSLPPSRPPSQGFQTMDMDDNMNFGSSLPPSRPPSQGFQTMDMDDNMNFGSSLPQSRPPSQGFQTMDMDDNMNFGSSQNQMYTQELFSSQPTSQQHLFDPDYGNEAHDTEYKYSPYIYNPLDTGPGTSRSSQRPSSSQQMPKVKKPGF